MTLESALIIIFLILFIAFLVAEVKDALNKADNRSFQLMERDDQIRERDRQIMKRDQQIYECKKLISNLYANKRKRKRNER